TDRSAFFATYIGRETFGKAANGVTISDATLPLFTNHFLPWTPLLLGLCTTRVRRWTPGERRVLRLAAAFALPTMIFFALHPYRNGVYIMPALPALAVLVAVVWRRSFRVNASRIRRWTLSAAALALSFTTIVMTIAIVHFGPFPAWWGNATSVTVLCGLAAG